MTDAVVLGVIGHVDHGKTSLVRALTGTDTDRLAEEKRRGISIALGFAHLASADGTVVDLVDMPGHERFVRTMISGATGIRVVLLVVAADDGVRPQTVEHVEIASLLGIRDALLAVTRSDLADEATAAAVMREAQALLVAAGFAVRSSHRVSSRTGDGIGPLRDAVAAVGALAPPAAADDDGWTFLPVDRAFSLPGAGTVVTGTLRRGPVREGDELDALVPGAPLGATRVRVRAVHTRSTRVARAVPGGRTALNLRAIEPGALPRGTVIATRGALVPARRIAVRLRAAAGAPPLATGRTLLLLAGTDEVRVRLRLLDTDTLEPAGEAFAELVADRAVALPARERFVLRLASPPATVAGGTVLSVGETRLRRRHAPTIERLALRAGATQAAIVADVLGRAGIEGMTLADLGREAGVSAARAASLLAGTGATIGARGGVAIAADGWQRLLRRLAAGVASGQQPVSTAPFVEEAVAALVRGGVLVRDGSRLAVRDARRDAMRARSEDAVAHHLLDRVRAGGLAPPPVSDLAPDPATRRMLDRLVRAGALVWATDRVQKRDWVFHPDAVAAARDTLGAALATRPAGLLVGEVGTVLGITRRHAVPLLEHLDGTRFTRRVGDRRLAGPSVR